MRDFSFLRLWAVILKEFKQMGRDKVTFGIMIGIPLIQLILFGFAIDLNPKQLPTAVVMQQPDPVSRDILQRMSQSQYFVFKYPHVDIKTAKKLLKTNQVKFIVYFPANFYRNVVRGLQPQVLLLVDGSDPIASGRAVMAFHDIANYVGQHQLQDRSIFIKKDERLFHPLSLSAFNPSINTAFHIVPALMGVVLTMTMVLITALAISREFERGTMEMLLSTPLQPLEVMIGKIVPYIMVGYVQVILILSLGKLLFAITIKGSLMLLLLMCLPFISANLAMGLTFSTLARNQLQAMQSTMFFLLPSILLSGFMFPFQGMPAWAQFVGNCLPLTHFLIIVRGIIMRGNGWSEIYPEVFYILAFMLVVMLVTLRRYRHTLD
jgi:ABC-2 type transport system permease protein